MAAGGTQPTTTNEALLMHQCNNLFQENYQRSQNEQALYIEWLRVGNENKELNNIIAQMQSNINKLEIQIKKLSNQSNTVRTQEKTLTSQEEYWTDEEELARETEWIRVKSRQNKRKKMDTSFTPPTPQTNKNRTNIPDAKVKKIQPPPPIVVEGIKEYNKFVELLLQKISPDKFTTKMVNKESYRINTIDEDTYRAAAKILRDQTTHTWFTYEDKRKRPIKVVAKYLPHSCQPNSIIDNLVSRGFKALNATNKIKWRTNEPLDMFILTFDSSEDINKIHAIKHVLQCKVEIEPFKSSKLIPQCKKCQAYGHTQRYCAKEARCVKCAGKHHTKDCTKPKKDKPKCVHCGEEHPANYRGCTVAIELQKIRNKAINKNKTIRIHPSVTKLTNKNLTFTNVVTNERKDDKNEQQNNSIEQTLQLILAKLENQEKAISTFDERLKRLEYSAKGAIPKQKNV